MPSSACQQGQVWAGGGLPAGCDQRRPAGGVQPGGAGAPLRRAAGRLPGGAAAGAGGQRSAVPSWEGGLARGQSNRELRRAGRVGLALCLPCPGSWLPDCPQGAAACRQALLTSQCPLQHLPILPFLLLRPLSHLCLLALLPLPGRTTPRCASAGRRRASLQSAASRRCPQRRRRAASWRPWRARCWSVRRRWAEPALARPSAEHALLLVMPQALALALKLSWLVDGGSWLRRAAGLG